RIFAVGLIYDLTFLLYALAPLALYLLLCPRRLWQRRAAWTLFAGLLLGGLFAMGFTAVAEWLFWDEFGVRFNFNAVDYLVYSEEVINSILESYPIYPLLALLFVLALGATWLLRGTQRTGFAAPLLPWRARLAALGLWGLALVGAAQFIGQDFPAGSGGNAYQRELAANGPYQFFAAFRNNELDY